MLFCNGASVQSKVSANLCQQQLCQCKGTFAAAEETSTAFPLRPVVLSHSAELGAGFWKAYCHGEESEQSFTFYTIQLVSFIFILFYFSLDYPSVGMVSSKHAERWRLLPYGLQCDHTFHHAKGRCHLNLSKLFIEHSEQLAKNCMY